MASELQTVVVEHPNSRPCARDCRFADPRAVELAVLVQRDCRRGFFIPARRSVRPMADASCPVSEQENVRVGQTLAGSAGSTPAMTRWGFVGRWRPRGGGGPATPGGRPPLSSPGWGGGRRHRPNPPPPLN